MKHEEAWTRLPDLLQDRDDAALLSHVSGCDTCQRQLFLLGRVDRLLRERTPSSGATHRSRLRAPGVFAVAATLAAAAAVALALVLSQHTHGHTMVLRTAAGQPVGRAAMSRSDARNVSLAFTARGLPVDRGHMFVLWAGDNRHRPMEVGRFMVDQSGGCRVHFNLPATHEWARFWIARQGSPAAIVAST